MLRVFLLLLISINCFSQIDTTKVKIVSKEFNKCFNNKYAPNSNTNQDCSNIVYIKYPQIFTNSEKTNKFLNDTIHKTVFKDKYLFLTDSICTECNCLEGNNEYGPSLLFLVKYKVFFANSDFISLSINRTSRPGEKGEGYHELVFPFTYDLKQEKYLNLKDILNKKKHNRVCKIIINQLKINYASYFSSYDSSSNIESLREIKSILDYPIIIEKQGVKIYWNMKTANVYKDVEIFLDFNLNNIFNKEIIKRIKNNSP